MIKYNYFLYGYTTSTIVFNTAFESEAMTNEYGMNERTIGPGHQAIPDLVPIPIMPIISK